MASHFLCTSIPHHNIINVLQQKNIFSFDVDLLTIKILQHGNCKKSSAG